MPVVTIRGMMGSFAPEIGKVVADRINADYIDREIIKDVAQKLKWSQQGIEDKEEPPTTLMGRILDALAHTYPSGEGYPGAFLHAWEIPLDDAHYLEGLEHVVKELANNKSVVIRGRGSQFILKDYPGVFHVLIVSPMELRIQRTMERLNIDENKAKKEIERFDQSRREFAKRYFHTEMEDPANYHLVLNTGYFTEEQAVSIIVNCIGLKDNKVKNSQ